MRSDLRRALSALDEELEHLAVRDGELGDGSPEGLSCLGPFGHVHGTLALSFLESLRIHLAPALAAQVVDVMDQDADEPRHQTPRGVPPFGPLEGGEERGLEQVIDLPGIPHEVRGHPQEFL